MNLLMFFCESDAVALGFFKIAAGRVFDRPNFDFELMSLKRSLSKSSVSFIIDLNVYFNTLKGLKISEKIETKKTCKNGRIIDIIKLSDFTDLIVQLT